MGWHALHVLPTVACSQATRASCVQQAGIWSVYQQTQTALITHASPLTSTLHAGPDAGLPNLLQQAVESASLFLTNPVSANLALVQVRSTTSNPLIRTAQPE
jgi:hypothetical protein